ncbi:hypothetical protein [Roseateles koreensis]|uniref:SGNH hydrolase-type esterase domain-containing protein n=1 Tax=Roseateles koreensis TaxID=2987526 RepID=A0ABT5KPJ6_9BURK|nr:hypothetical protein [Roseateles koreensis]MDC8784845.1 hypothetical protein [Roseateles koreensis]
MNHLACFTPGDLAAASAPDLTSYRWRLLAQGDSWFSTADDKLNAHANLLQEMVYKEPTCAVNCAGKGGTLSHLVDLESAPDFVRLLSDKDSTVWDGVLLSMGGNDLISAAQTPAHDAAGNRVPLHLRLLRHQTEWGAPSSGVARYFSEPGWATYSDYLRTNVRHLLTLRDQGPSAGKPMFMHCYAVPMPRPAGAEDVGLGQSGPWLYPALKAYALPAADWAAVSRLMVFHLAQLLKSMAADPVQFPGLHVFDSTTVPLAPATPGSSGSSGDWHNEIHLNHSGCFKIARAWSEHVEAVLSGAHTAAPVKRSRR